MKKTILTFCFSISIVLLNAQSLHKQWMIGANGSFATAQETFQGRLKLSANGGYFLLPNLMIGVETNLNFIKSVKETPYHRYYTVGIPIRYYLTSGKLKPFVIGSVGAGTMSGNIHQFSGIYEDIFTLKSGIGLNYLVNESIALELLPMFEGIKHINDFWEFQATINFGIQYFFKIKKH